MKWLNLKQNKCPECDGDLVGSSKTYKNNAGQKVIEHKCGFRISELKFQKIVNSQVTKGLNDKYIEPSDEGENMPGGW